MVQKIGRRKKPTTRQKIKKKYVQYRNTLSEAYKAMPKKQIKKVGAGSKGTSHKVKASLDRYKQTKTIKSWLKELR